MLVSAAVTRAGPPPSRHEPDEAAIAAVCFAICAVLALIAQVLP